MIPALSVPAWTTRIILTAALAAHAAPVLAQSYLSSAESFAVLGASTVSSAGLTTIHGDLGVSPGSSISGFPPGLLAGGAMHYGDTLALQAHADAALAYTALAGTACPPGSDVTGRDLGSLGTLYPGTYCSSSPATVTGTVVLDAGGNPNALFIFKTSGTLTIAAGAAVVVINGAPACHGANVFWQVAGSAYVGADSTIVGSLLALESISLGDGATVDGSILAITGAVTMSTNVLSACTSGAALPPLPPGIPVTGLGQISVPDPNSAGRGSFSFKVRPGVAPGDPARGHFAFVDHVTGLHVEGPVTSVVVIAVYPNGAPKAVAFAGTCTEAACVGSGAPCSFAITVEDHGQRGWNDEVGILITGGMAEIVSQRTVSRGNVTFH